LNFVSVYTIEFHRRLHNHFGLNITQQVWEVQPVWRQISREMRKANSAISCLLQRG